MSEPTPQQIRDDVDRALDHPGSTLEQAELIPKWANWLYAYADALTEGRVLPRCETCGGQPTYRVGNVTDQQIHDGPKAGEVVTCPTCHGRGTPALVLWPEEGKTIEVEEEWVCRDERADFKCRGEESRAHYAARPSFSSDGGVWHYGTHESCGLSLRVSGWCVVPGRREERHDL